MAFTLCVFQKRLCIVVVQTGSGTHFGGYDLQGTPAPAGNAPWRRGHLAATGAQDAILPHIRKGGGRWWIGIGGSLAAPPLPHHRTCGSAYGGSAG